MSEVTETGGRRRKFVEGLGDLVLGTVRVLRAAEHLHDTAERRRRAFALRFVARTLAEEAMRLESPSGVADDQRRDDIRADFFAAVEAAR